MTYYKKSVSVSVNQEEELGLLQLFSSSIIHFDKMSETEHVYFSHAVTTSITIYLWRHQMPQHTAVWFLCRAWLHHYRAMTLLRWLNYDCEVACIRDYSVWQKKEGPLTLHKDFYLCLYPSTDILNTCSWLQVNDSKCSREEQALLLALRHPSA